MKPENIDGGFRIYQHPTDLWPAEWGDCKDLLGFGTVNPFENFEEKFALVYDASRPSSTEREQPWWKPWGKAPTPKNDIGCLVAIASCLLWPVGIFLACAYLLKSRQREAVQAGLIGVLGIMLMQILSAIDVSIKQTGRLEYLNLAYIGYSVVAVFAAIVVHSWLKQQSWLSGR